METWFCFENIFRIKSHNGQKKKEIWIKKKSYNEIGYVFTQKNVHAFITMFFLVELNQLYFLVLDI